MKRKLIFPLLFLFVAELILFGQTDNWEKTNGPYGTSWIYDIEIDPANNNRIYIATNRGLYLSEDGSETWNEITSADFVDLNVLSIAINPTNPEIILVATNSEIYRTMDRGLSWEKIAGNIANAGWFAFMKYSPGDSKTLYLAGADFKWIQETDTDIATSRVWRSYDDGNNWEVVYSTSNQKFRIENFTISPHDSTRIYLGTSPRDTTNTGGPGVFISTDYGGSWETFVKDEPLEGRMVFTIEVDPIDPEIVYVGTSVNDDPFGPGSLCIKTENHGLSWSEILDRSFGGMERVRRIHIHPTNNDTLYICGDRLFFRSNNGGLSYDGNIHSSNYFTAGVFPPNEGDHEIKFNDPPLVYSGGYGFYKSADGGKNFKLKNIGIESEKTRCIKVDPFNPDNVYTITFTGYGNQYTHDGGETWHLPESSVLNNYGMLLEVSQSNPNNVYATCTGGLWKSVDKGITWSWTNSQFQNSHVHGLAISPFDDNTIYVGVGRDRSNPTGQGLYKTTDGGDSWKNINNGFPDDVHVAEIKIDPTNPEIVYIATRGHQEGGGIDMPVTEGKGVYKTINGGEDWFPVNNGINNLSISSVVINPRNPGVLYASASSEHHLQHLERQGTIYKSINAGESWTEANDGLEWPAGMDIPLNIHSLVICPEDPDIVYATAMSSNLDHYQGSVFKTMNGGEQWVLFNEGLNRAGSENYQAVEYIDLDPTGDIIYCAINSGVVHKIDNTPASDTSPPVIIAGPALFDNTPFSVNIRWNTHEAGTSIIEYGLTEEYGQSLSSDSMTFFHSMKLNDLNNLESFHFRVGSIDALGNGPVWSEDFTLTLANDKMPPEISNLNEIDDTNSKGPFLITCDVFDLYGVEEVVLFYKAEYDEDFLEIEMNNTEENQYQGSIPMQTDAGFLDYYLVAKDSSGNIVRVPDTAPFGTFGFKIYNTLHRDQTYMYLAQFDGAPISRMDLSTLEEEDLVFDHVPYQGWRGDLSKSSNDSLLARTVYNLLGIFDARSGLLIDTIYTPLCNSGDDNCLGKSVFSNDAKYVYAIKYCNGVANRISKFNIHEFTYENDIYFDPDFQNINDIEISEDDTELFVVQTDESEGRIFIVDLVNNLVKETIDLGIEAYNLSLSNDYKYLYCFNSVYAFPLFKSFISKIDLSNYEVVDSLDITGPYLGEQFDLVENRKGNGLFVLVTGNQVLLADLDSLSVQWSKSIPVTTSGVTNEVLRHNNDRYYYFPRLDDGLGQIHKFDVVTNEFSIFNSHLNLGGTELITVKRKINSPDSFDLSSPGMGDTVHLPEIILKWEEASDLDPGDQVKYRIIYSFEEDFADSIIIEDLTDLSYILSHGLLSGTRLWWKVVAYDTYGLSRTSNQVFQFYYEYDESVNYPPNPFSLHFPPNDAVISTSEVNLIWEKTTDVNSEDQIVYDLYYSNQSDFTDQTIVRSLNDTSYLIPACFTSATEIWWKVKAIDSYGNVTDCKKVFHFLVNECDPTNIDYIPQETDYFLSQNFPNPVGGLTSIRFGVEEHSNVQLKLFDIYGRELITILNEKHPIGLYDITIDLSCYASGYYIYKIQMNDFEDSRMLFCK